LSTGPWGIWYVLMSEEFDCKEQVLTCLGIVQLCLASGAVYLEFTAYFPSRSGSEVVFLEQAYPRPRWLFPTTFAVQSVILSFGSANATGKSSNLYASTKTRLTLLDSNGKLPDCDIRARRHELADQRHGTGLLQSCHTE
jgi:hypothetical protein